MASYARTAGTEDAINFAGASPSWDFTLAPDEGPTGGFTPCILRGISPHTRRGDASTRLRCAMLIGLTE